jgi:U2-associated protein SR140
VPPMILVRGRRNDSRSVMLIQVCIDSDTAAAAHPKPTLLLSSLPPNITKAVITDLLSSTPLKIDSVRIIPAPPPTGPSQPSLSIRKAASALVTLSQETPISDVDAAVSSLNGRYMGYGFWLGIVRHLSSTVAGSAPTGIPIIGTQANPFGAKAPRPAGPSGGRGGPHRGGFAPPSSFGLSARAQQQPGALQVHVQPPQDLKVLKLIHRTIESLLTHGTEFEALLMSQDSVRNDPKFAWLWDARSPAGVYYRWKLWEIVTGFSIDKPYTPTVDIFDSAGGAVWVPPKKPLKYEWASSLKDVVEDYDFMSDELDEDDSDAEDHRHHDDDRPVGLAGGDGGGKKQKGYLGVLESAKLIHLISRIPTATTKVRRGDVGRVMAFAMEHAEGGMGEEIVEILVSNVLNPLACTKAAKRNPEDSEDSAEAAAAMADEKPDASAAKIVALWIISDVLSNSSLGVRAAWRYRQLFDTALREKRVFEHLGEVYRESGWGRMKAEKFRRMVVEGVLEGWEVCPYHHSSTLHYTNKGRNGAFSPKRPTTPSCTPSCTGPKRRRKKRPPKTQCSNAMGNRSRAPIRPSLRPPRAAGKRSMPPRVCLIRRRQWTTMTM